ncbi:PRC-barrel domain-containing protein [Guptibacillus algicola]|uniref:PRC-barrel domain containing protein n=1 Tax=Guptibacillus algicola TaxID=225844 RepID=UPI001CD7D780|nr:PRC-barrel domain-containing protein [Alkalihalobacillus algicola]MCA0989171.1 PRC-barrel domain-containing protein [Alkalihalobacillus algicola]
MLVSENEIYKYSIDTSDGEKGALKELYFDDEHWAVRYLVVDTRKWLPGRKILLSPYSIEKLTHDKEEISVSLSTDELKNSPSIDADQTISRKHEMSINKHYGWPYYWVGTGAWGSGMYPTPQETNPESYYDERGKDDNHLRSTKEVSNYHIQATDGEIGHVEDFIFDDKTWKLRYFVVDTKDLLHGKKVLLSTEWIDDIHWTDRSVVVNVTKEKIENAPEYLLNEPLTRRFEEDLYTHYGKTGYWKF